MATVGEVVASRCAGGRAAEDVVLSHNVGRVPAAAEAAERDPAARWPRPRRGDVLAGQRDPSHRVSAHHCPAHKGAEERLALGLGVGPRVVAQVDAVAVDEPVAEVPGAETQHKQAVVLTL